MNLDIRPISGSLSAEIRGVNLSHDLTEGTVAAIRQTFLDHIVIFFRGQDLPSEQFLAFAHRIGRPVEYPFVKGLDGVHVPLPLDSLGAGTVGQPMRVALGVERL